MAEHDLWVDWLEREWNRPSRSDHYLMLLAALVDAVPGRVWGRGGPAPRPDEYRVPFVFKRPGPAPGPGGEVEDVPAAPPGAPPVPRPPRPLTARDVVTIRAADAKHRAEQLAKARPPGAARPGAAAAAPTYTGRPAARRPRTNDDEVTDVPPGQPPPW